MQMLATMFQQLGKPAKQHVSQEPINLTQGRMVATMLMLVHTFQQLGKQVKLIVQQEPINH